MQHANFIPPGLPFFEWWTRRLASSYALPYVHVAEVSGESWDRMKVIAGVTRGDPVAPFEYDLAGTPCETAMTDADCEIHRDVLLLYPHDEMLVRFGAQSYFGSRLNDESGRPIGVLSTFDDQPVESYAALKAEIELVRPRLIGEISLRLAMREREALIQGTTLPSTENVFQALAWTLARSLGVKVAFVAELLRDEPDSARTLGLVVDGREAAPIKGRLSTSPCGDVYANGVSFVRHHVWQRYPESPSLQGWNAETYLAIAFRDCAGRWIGHVGVIHDRPLLDRPGVHELLRMIAMRAGFELERHRAIEERVALERKLLEAQRLESLGLLAGGVAHDFNNLLVGILGNASLALADLDAEDPVRKSIHAIELAGQQAADLARQMLAYSGKGRVDVRLIDVNQLVRETLHLLERSISRRVQVRYDLVETAPVILADAAQIRQVVMNLALNSAEAIGDADGAIDVSTTIRPVTENEFAAAVVGRDAPSGRYVAIEVRDSGCGMTPETLNRIFDPFFSTKFTGRGLGLAAVHGIVRSHGGALDVRSAPGQGSAFRIFLPLSDGLIERASASDARGARLSGAGAVLIIDDEQLVRDTAARIIEHSGFETILATDGSSGIEVFKLRRSDVRAVLLDLTMPGMNGVDVLRALRVIDPAVKVVLMTGFDERDALSRFDDDGPSAFLGKPFRVSDVIDRIRALVDV